jgi:hypothetical protein
MINTQLSEICTLLISTPTVDDIGNTISDYAEKRIFCGKKSITGAEYYRGRELGIMHQLCLVTPSINYDGEQKAVYKGNKYKIYRTYDLGNGYTELYLQEETKE